MLPEPVPVPVPVPVEQQQLLPVAVSSQASTPLGLVLSSSPSRDSPLDPARSAV